MTKDWDKAQSELEALEESYWAEWQRLVLGNAEFGRELRQLRRRFGLPLHERKLKQLLAWWDEQDREGFPLQAELQALATKHGLWERWGQDLLNFAVYNTTGGILLTNRKGKVVIEGGQGQESKIVIGQDVNIRNPIVQRQIEAWQTVKDDPPPTPGPYTNARDKRKLDWRPLWEWVQRHPEKSITALADELGYERSYFSRKLSAAANEEK